MNPSIKAILFDIGGTLRIVHKSKNRSLATLQKMQALVGDTGDAQKFAHKLVEGEKQYRVWCKNTLSELNEAGLWTRFMLPDSPTTMVAENAIALNQLWREAHSNSFLPGSVELLRTLAARGYILAIVSNTTSSVEVPKLLKEYGIEALFSSVLLSTVYGKRKPHPAMFLTAARECGVNPLECAYIGDRPSRDVVGSRVAGIGKVVIVQHQFTESETDPCPMRADVVIQDISELIQIFPPLEIPARKNSETPRPFFLYDAALSTMWWSRQTDTASDFFSKGRGLGFASFELNHQIMPEEFAGMDFNHYNINTLHDPCPAVIHAKQLEKEDLQVTSLDETRRRVGVDTVKHTIEQACNLGARSVVIHPGRIAGDHAMDNQLRGMYRAGLQGTAEYEQLRLELIADRKVRGQPHLDALMKSLSEIVDFTKSTGISLGFENRFHYYELPIYHELEAILLEFQQPWVGWQLDVGHLQVHHALGLMNFREWLEHFGSRIIGVHLHDVQGLVDHRSPGSGDVDFRLVAAHLPTHAHRTLEVDKSLTFEQVHLGMENLVAAGCVIRL